jgi:hypothetical protein
VEKQSYGAKPVTSAQGMYVLSSPGSMQPAEHKQTDLTDGLGSKLPRLGTSTCARAHTTLLPVPRG